MSKTPASAIKLEFVGLASNVIPDADALITVESLGMDSWVVLEEEPRTGID